MLNKAVFLVGFSFLGQACNSVTEAPICDWSNYVNVPGISGTYELSFYDSAKFKTITEEFQISASDGGVITLLDQNDAKKEARTCQVNGRFIQESYDKKNLGYSQQYLFVDGTGISLSPIMYDRDVLKKNGIESDVVSWNEADLSSLSKSMSRLGSALRNRSALGLMVYNDGSMATMALSAAKPGPFHLTFIRK